MIGYTRTGVRERDGARLPGRVSPQAGGSSPRQGVVASAPGVAAFVPQHRAAPNSASASLIADFAPPQALAPPDTASAGLTLCAAVHPRSRRLAPLGELEQRHIRLAVLRGVG
jgi:hypothetical protein